ncbi:MAG: AAA family ATPase [Phycisphaeraceae bacterium]|nr:AAA family ATPase [Phycisphaeraceae bacterium]
MRTIAIINQKGGCGKTTVSINLAATLAAQGHRTLLVDMDPQAHCAMGLAVPDAQIERSTSDLMRAGLDGSLAVADIVWQISRNFDLAPSTIQLAGIEQQLSGAADRDRRLSQVLSTVQQRYDFCVIDCPPSIGLLTFNALRAADEVIIPVETGYFALQGSVRQEQTIEMLARRAGHRVRFSVLATMYDVRTKLAREILSELKRQFAGKLLPVVINFNSKLKEAASFGQPITEYDAASRGMADFERLYAWLMANPPQPPSMEEFEAAGVGAEASDPLIATSSPPRNAAMSRAAELVERARALSARTAAISARLSADEDMIAEDLNEPARPPVRVDADLNPLTRAGDDRPTIGSNVQVRERLNSVYGVRPTTQGLLFVQPADMARRMAIAGDFNGWNPERTPMIANEQLGVWQACVPVPPGRYQYRLVVDGQWVADPYNEKTESNPYGEVNNVIEIA